MPGYTGARTLSGTSSTACAASPLSSGTLKLSITHMPQTSRSPPVTAMCPAESVGPSTRVMA